MNDFTPEPPSSRPQPQPSKRPKSAVESEGTNADVSLRRQPVSRRGTTLPSAGGYRERVWLRALQTVHRFRVIRTIDVAVVAFPDRPFKASLTAAQRTVRALVKADFLRRYKTKRFQTVYALTSAGAQWLQAHDLDGTSSTRRVSDMTNPEHRLWSQFLVLCAEARGIRAESEGELLARLSDTQRCEKSSSGLLRQQRGTAERWLRPDAIAVDGAEVSWIEVFTSYPGDARAESLRALLMSIGGPLVDGSRLSHVALFAGSKRIEKRLAALLRDLEATTKGQVLIGHRHRFVEIEPGVYEVSAAMTVQVDELRSGLQEVVVGYVTVQALPTWLPKVRIDAKNRYSMAGWLTENYLPYRRPQVLGAWPSPQNPLGREGQQTQFAK